MGSKYLFTRRDFLKAMGAAALGLAASGYLPRLFPKSDIFSAHAITDIGYSREAMFYEKLDHETVRCLLCPNQCILKDGQRSFCRVREPKDNTLYTLVYELACAVHVDPIEKKPLYHVLPGTSAFSIATAGCNLRCKFCQNWQISQNPPENTQNKTLTCGKVLELAAKSGCKSIAYTYSEPTIFYEYMIDTAGLARKYNIKNIYKSAAYIKAAPLKLLCKSIDAANIDLKAFSDKFLKEVCGQRLEPLLEALKIIKTEGVWIELTNLIVPTLNDDMNMIRQMCAWIRGNMGKDTPLHFSRFWPMYKLRNLPPTPVSTLEEARSVAFEEGLSYVYIGNIASHESNHTYCPGCKKAVIKRYGYQIVENNVRGSACNFCGYRIAGIWK